MSKARGLLPSKLSLCIPVTYIVGNQSFSDKFVEWIFHWLPIHEYINTGQNTPSLLYLVSYKHTKRGNYLPFASGVVIPVLKHHPSPLLGGSSRETKVHHPLAGSMEKPSGPSHAEQWERPGNFGQFPILVDSSMMQNRQTIGVLDPRKRISPHPVGLQKLMLKDNLEVQAHCFKDDPN